jgi:hypothetical protein
MGETTKPQAENALLVSMRDRVKCCFENSRCHIVLDSLEIIKMNEKGSVLLGQIISSGVMAMDDLIDYFSSTWNVPKYQARKEVYYFLYKLDKLHLLRVFANEDSPGKPSRRN